MIFSGRKTWSWLSPAVGVAALCPLAWWTVRLPGEGTAAIISIAVTTIAAALFVVPRVEGFRTALRRGTGVGLAALALASLPFFVEGRFGILGTGLNPDMSQHLFAVDRLAMGGTERLIAEGYPLGPHSIVAALAELGPSTVQAFGGLSLFIAVAACLAPSGTARHAVGLASLRWRARDRLRLLGRGVLGSGRVQGNDAGPVRPRLCDRAGTADSAVADKGRRCRTAASRPAVRRARDRQRLRLQLSWPAVARRRLRCLGRDRARSRRSRRNRGQSPQHGSSRLANRPGRDRCAAGRDHPRARADRQLRQLRDLQPQRRWPRQSLRSAFAPTGARHLAVGGLSRRARRRRDCGAVLLSRRRLRACGVGVRPCLVVARRRAHRSCGAGGGALVCGSTRWRLAPPTRRQKRSCSRPRWWR